MTDFCITAVRYSSNGSHIEYVYVNEELPGKIGSNRVVPRAFVADLIRMKKATFQTRVETPEGKFRVGAAVHVIDDQYLTTDPNSTKRDNLGNLPQF
ncbi:TPA: DUF3892 domain-containing protein [Stenotrophomonas maltophilia]